MTSIFSDFGEKIVEVFMDDFSIYGISFDDCLSNHDQSSDSLPWIKLFQQGPTLVLNLPNNLSLFLFGYHSPAVIFM